MRIMKITIIIIIIIIIMKIMKYLENKDILFLVTNQHQMTTASHVNKTHNGI